MSRYEALMACRKAAGSDSKMGRDLGIPQSTMWRILHQTKRLPAEYVLQAERLYGVSRHDLRPDIYPREQLVDQRAGGRMFGIDRGAVSHQRGIQA